MGNLKHRGVPIRVIALAMAAVVGALFAPARVAAAEIYTWSSCNWSLVEHGSLPDYTYRSHNMPADGWGDGVKNSFVDRIADSVSRWNAALASAGRTGRLVPATTSDERISIYYQTISGVARGITAINLDLSPEFCVLNDGSGSDPVFSAQIYVTVLPYWFTQDDSRRSYWETRT